MTNKNNSKFSAKGGSASGGKNKTDKNQKASINRDSLTRWAVDLHHTRLSEQSGFRAVAHLLGFTHQSHRNADYIQYENKNNPEVALEVVFSSFKSVVNCLKTLVLSIAEPTLMSIGYQHLGISSFSMTNFKIQKSKSKMTNFKIKN